MDILENNNIVLSEEDEIAAQKLFQEILDKETDFADDLPDTPLSSDIGSLEADAAHLSLIWEKFFTNQFDDVPEILSARCKTSMEHALAHAAHAAVYGMCNDKQELLQDAVRFATYSAKLANKYRRKRTASSYIVKCDVNDYTDRECLAELNYAESTALLAFLAAFIDRMSVMGAIKGAVKIKISHSAFKECERIAEERTNWTSPVLRHNFEGAAFYAVACFHLVISYAPKFLARLLEFVGFSGDRVLAVQLLRKCATYTESTRFPYMSVTLPIYNAISEFVMGNGEPDLQLFTETFRYWSEKAPESIMLAIAGAFRDQVEGNFESSIVNYDKIIQTADRFNSIRYAAQWQKMWIYSVQWDWQKATETAKVLKDEWFLSPSLFAFCHGAMMSMLPDAHLPHMQSEIISIFSSVSKIKKNFGGRIAFHENIVAAKAKFFVKHPERMLLVPLDVMYIFNAFNVAAAKDGCLDAIIKKLDEQLLRFPKKDNLEAYCFLTFFKGVCFSRKAAHLIAEEHFLEIIACQKKLKRERHLAPQACLEMGLISRAMGKAKQMDLWFSKAINYPSHHAEALIESRVDSAKYKLKKAD